MENVQLWKLALDGMLVLSLLYFCLKFARDSGSRLNTRALGLETSLRALIRDAEKAGTALNSELVKRQSDLEKALFDIRAVENRLETAIRNAETLKGSFGPELSQAEHVIRQLHEATAAAGNHIARPSAEQVPTQPTPQQIMANRSELDRRVTVESVEIAEKPVEPAQVSKPQEPQPTQKARQSVNIYGEPIGAPVEEPVAEPKAQTMQQQIETVREPAPQQQQAPTKPETTGQSEQRVIQEVYDQAEQLLKAGSDLRSVANQTRLSIDEVRMLAQMVESDHAEQAELEAVSRTDERLGVLGSIKRQVQQV